ncbi:MAG: AMP-binding protein [Gallionellaceae bacterium]|nr:AMP-binding protein [Gallionellaceae bacterium]
MVALPLLSHNNPASTFAYSGERSMSAGQFLSDVLELSAQLPQRQYILNLCSDRYRFAVGFAAALLRQQINLLPPNTTTGMVEQLRHQYPDLYCLTDGGSTLPALECMPYPQMAGLSSDFAFPPTVPVAQTAAIVFTSGSTGLPVAHLKSWGSLVKSAQVEAERLNLGPHFPATILATVPSQHMYGLESALLIAMQNGLAFCAEHPFYPTDICTHLAHLPQPRGLVTTPIHLRALLAENINLPAVDFVVCATAPLSAQLAADAETRFQAPLHEIYGCTEAGQIATRRPAQSPEWRTFSELKLRQGIDGIWVSGGHVEREILLNDVLELHDEETFLLHGRAADLVNIAGKRTSLSHLNFHLNAIAGVVDGVFIMPNETGNKLTRPLALVVAPSLSRTAILTALRQRIDPVFLPRPLHFVDALPRNSTGKLPHAALEQLLHQFTKASTD